MAILLGSALAEADRRRFFKTQLVFWLLTATDGHAKNFSIFHLLHSRFQSTPLYDVLSAHPIIGPGAHQLPRQNSRLAMAVRGVSNHYHMEQIQRRHWLRQDSFGAAAAQDVIDEVLGQADAVVATMRGLQPPGFPADLAGAILQGMSRQARRLRDMPGGEAGAGPV